ncbi:unnamed protein product [Haemonchus placei]|uniref:Uncharacterized protein n=1 Tax=Haemonchus placei TaxID=6290 RepID=A0A3P7WXV4_HAEPC|nr:unnamed protein product [Haemonchus placei]
MQATMNSNLPLHSAQPCANECNFWGEFFGKTRSTDQSAQYVILIRRVKSHRGRHVATAPLHFIEMTKCDGPCGHTYPPESLDLLGRCGHFLCKVCHGLVQNDDGMLNRAFMLVNHRRQKGVSKKYIQKRAHYEASKEKWPRSPLSSPIEQRCDERMKQCSRIPIILANRHRQGGPGRGRILIMLRPR